MSGSATELQCRLGRNRLNIGDAADAIGSKNLCRLLLHVPTETLGWQFVNGKVSWSDRFLAIVIAQENTLAVESERDGVPF